MEEEDKGFFSRLAEQGEMALNSAYQLFFKEEKTEPSKVEENGKSVEEACTPEEVTISNPEVEILEARVRSPIMNGHDLQNRLDLHRQLDMAKQAIEESCNPEEVAVNNPEIDILRAQLGSPVMNRHDLQQRMEAQIELREIKLEEACEKSPAVPSASPCETTRERGL